MPVYKRDRFGRTVKGNKKEGTWWFDFMVNRKRYKGAIKGATTKQQAEKYEAEKRLEVFEGRYGKPAKATSFKQFVDDVYLKWSKQHKRSYEWDRLHCGILCDYFDGKLLREITPANIEKYKCDRHEQATIRKMPRKGSSVNRELALLSVLFNLAISLEYCESNPCARVKRFKGSGRCERVLSLEEEGRLMAVLTGSAAYLRPLVVIALGTGMRRGEILNLRWEDIDVEKSLIRIRAMTTKAGKARIAPMNSDVRTTLCELRGEKNEGHIFSIRPNTVSSRFSELCDQMGMEDVTFHTLRHTFDTRLIDRNVNPFVVKELMGHATLAMTSHYTHVSVAELQRAVETLEKVS